MVSFNKLRDIFLSEENVVRVYANKVLVVGDTHGYIESTKKALEYGEKADIIVFLGDYVDRGPYQVENINLLFSMKEKYPKRIILLRGNHETRMANMYYGFMGIAGEEYQEYIRIFRIMPVAAILNDEIIMLHGGLPREVKEIKDLERLPRNDEEVKDPVLLQVLWNDPSPDVDEFAPSIRGEGIYYFGRAPLERFLSRNSLKMMIRAHEVKKEGYQYLFANKLLTVFSATGYVGLDVKGKVALIHKDRIDLLPV